MQLKKTFAMWQKVLIGLGLGIVLGLLLKGNTVFLKPFGDLFMRLIKMIIVPLIFFVIINGVTSVNDSKLLGRAGIKACIAYFLTTICSIIIGLGVGTLLKPGRGILLHMDQTAPLSSSNQSALSTILDSILNIVPDNAIGAMAQGTILQVVFFAFFTGITINAMDKESFKRITSGTQLLSKIFFKMIHFIIEVSPLAACCLTAWVIGTQGTDVLKNLIKLIGAAYLAFAIQFIVFWMIIYVWTRLSPYPFFKKSLEYQTIAFATSSSKAALPTTIKVCQEKLGISRLSSSFILPLGASINMNGIGIYISLCTLFFAQATGKVLGMNDYLIIMLTGTLGSIGGAGIPSGALVMLPMTLVSVGLPTEGVALLLGIDRVVDMMLTAVNITGDAVVTLCVDSSEGLLDKTQYLR